MWDHSADRDNAEKVIHRRWWGGGSRTAVGGASTFRNGGASGLALVDQVV
jgi:hypothetical protein